MMRFLKGHALDGATGMVAKALLIVAGATLLASQAAAHGWVTSPASRADLCSTGVNTNCGEIQNEPQSLEGPGGFPSLGGPADGHIASAGLSMFSTLDEQSSSRWHKVSLTSGATKDFTWKITASHHTENFRYYITKPDWDPSQPLTRADFEPLPFCIQAYNGQRPPATITQTCTLPNRSGYQVILGIYEVLDGGHNAFYQVIDADFGAGSGDSSGGLGGLNCPASSTWNPNASYAEGENVNYNGYSYHAKRMVPAGMKPDSHSGLGGIWVRNGPCGPDGSGTPPVSSGNPGSSGAPSSSGTPGSSGAPASSGNPGNSNGPACSSVAAWDADTVYTGGDTVSYNGTIYAASYWTKGDQPDQSGEWGPWTVKSGCSGGDSTPAPSSAPASSAPASSAPASSAPASSGPAPGKNCTAVSEWSADQVYTGGDKVTYQGQLYVAQWWTRGDNPAEVGQWGPWTAKNDCSGDSTPAPSSSAPASSAPASSAPPSSVPASSEPPSSEQPPTSGNGNLPPVPTGTPAGLPSNFILAPYVDITTDVNWQNGEMGSATNPPAGLQAVTWSFASGTCNSESWAGFSKEDMAANAPLYEAAGINYIVGVGGQVGSFDCSDPQNLIDMIARYDGPNMIGIDFDVEHSHNSAWANSLVESIAAAQDQYPDLEFSFTLATFGSWTRTQSQFNSDGQVVIDALQAHDMLGDVYINLMTMYYGAPAPDVCVVVNGKCDMGQSAIAAAMKLHKDWGVPYDHIQVTPYLGGTISGQFSLQDMDTVAAFAKQVGLSAVKWWALNIDPGYKYLDRANADGL